MAMNGAREVDEQTAPNLYHVVEDMAMVAQIPMPRVFVSMILRCRRGLENLLWLLNVFLQ